jgi:hypothetical protein
LIWEIEDTPLPDPNNPVIYPPLVVTGNAPIILSLSPTSGPIGTLVTIIGEHFTGVTSVTFGGFPAAFTVVNDTTITATAPIPF